MTASHHLPKPARMGAYRRLIHSRVASLALALSACGGDPDGEQRDTSTEPVTCEGLFGRPSEATGLTAEQCAPVCRCSDTDWEAPTYSAQDLEALRVWAPVEPFLELTTDPYAEAAPEVTPDEVCGFVAVDDSAKTYRLEGFVSWGAAEAAGAKVTHRGRCGVCSSLTNLATYIATPDLTSPVRDCGLVGIREGDEANIACLRELGFDEPCAQVWFYNTRHTREKCGATCFALLNAPYHEPDGSLNACLACDEEMSGAVFKAVAGRTRRNTGLASALCRPCAEVSRIVHRYP